jgi:hypothetical protein
MTAASADRQSGRSTALARVFMAVARPGSPVFNRRNLRPWGGRIAVWVGLGSCAASELDRGRAGCQCRVGGPGGVCARCKWPGARSFRRPAGPGPLRPRVAAGRRLRLRRTFGQGTEPPICRGSGVGVPGIGGPPPPPPPIFRGSGVHPHPHPRFASIGDQADSEYH